MLLQLARQSSVTLPDREPLELAPRDAALLAWLALEGPTPRNRLAQLLWPQSEPEAARNALRQRLFKLHRQFGGDSLVTGHATLALADGVRHDLHEADDVLGSVAQESFGGEFATWLEHQRERRRSRTRSTLIELCELAERARDFDDALSHAGELLALEPLSEDAHRRMMRLHYQRGDRAGALLAFDRCERMLKDEVGARPSADTLALLQAVEQSLAVVGAGDGNHHRTIAASPPPAVLRPPRLVGRTRELGAAFDAWTRGHVISLIGEAGLGKTRLLQELAAPHGGAVLAQARPGDSVVPYSALARLLRAIVERAPDALVVHTPQPELARLLPGAAGAIDAIGTAAASIDAVRPSSTTTPEGQRLALQREVAALLRNAAAAGLDTLLFDDLHFADDASLDLLLALMLACVRQAGAAPPLRFALARRPAEGSARLALLHEALLEENALTPITLQPLDEEQLHELVDSLGLEGVDAHALARQLHRLTGGNPLFALETLRQGWVESRLAGQALPRPTSVARLIERRLARLSLPAVRLARCAAIAGQDFSAELAARVLGVAALDLADAWAELDAAQVLRDGAFAHDLIHEGVLATVPAPVAQPLHAEIAAFLSARSAMPGRVAWHWAQAQRWPLAAPAYLHAATQARDAGRAVEQAALLDEAAHCFERAGDAAARFDALLLRAEVLGQSELGEQALDSVAAVTAAASNDAQRLRALLVQVQTGEMRGDSERTLELARQGIALAHAQGDREIELRFAIPLSGALAEHRRAAEAVALLEPLQALADQDGTPDELRWNHAVALAFALDYANRLGDALPVWRASLELARRMERNDLAWQAISNLASTQAKMGRVQLAVELSLQARQLARSSGEEMQGRTMQGQMTLAHRLRDLGRYAEAVPLLEEALALFRRKGGGSSDAAAVEHRLAQAFQQLGQPARSQQLLQVEHAQLPLGLAVMRQVHRADLAHQLGGDALTPMRGALALQPDTNDIYHRIATLFASAIVPPDEGEALATGLAAWASAHQRQGLALAGHVRAARCALAQGAARRALPQVEAALRLAQDHQPDSFYLPELWLVATRVLRSLDRVPDAEAVLRDGLAWVQHIGEQHVPAPFRDSFRQRNPVNRELLALAARTP